MEEAAEGGILEAAPPHSLFSVQPHWEEPAPMVFPSVVSGGGEPYAYSEQLEESNHCSNHEELEEPLEGNVPCTEEEAELWQKIYAKQLHAITRVARHWLLQAIWVSWITGIGYAAIIHRTDNWLQLLHLAQAHHILLLWHRTLSRVPIGKPR